MQAQNRVQDSGFRGQGRVQGLETGGGKGTGENFDGMDRMFRMGMKIFTTACHAQAWRALRGSQKIKIKIRSRNGLRRPEGQEESKLRIPTSSLDYSSTFEMSG